MPSVRFISLGCPKNLVDSEVMLGRLHEAGYQIASDGQPADIFIINTCCFIKSATEESEDIIRQARAMKQNGKYKRLVVAGCLPQRLLTAKGFVSNGYDDIDALVGVFNRDKIVEVCQSLLGESNDYRNKWLSMPLRAARRDNIRFQITPKHYAYLRIAEGCNNRCSYCVIPQLHGPYRSKPMSQVIKEAEALVAAGAVELNLIAQDTTSYGRDLYKKTSLIELLKRLSKINGLKWIRLLYAYPHYFSNELIEVVAEIPQVVKYIDLPIQHISGKILKLMRRKTSRQEIVKLIDRLRERIKGVVLRTSVIVGFPGEDESDFTELYDFIKEVRFERLGVFKYSAEAGTQAAQLSGQITESVKQERFNRIMKLQQGIAFHVDNQLNGRNIPVIIEAVSKKGVWLGRTYGDAPEVDGNIFVSSTRPAERSHRGQRSPVPNGANQSVEIGKIYNVRVTGSAGYDLIGTIHK